MQYNALVKHNFDFERYVRIHIEQHSVLTGLVEPRYSIIDESCKVRIILKGFAMPQYYVVNARILSSPAWNTSFARSVELYTVSTLSRKARLVFSRMCLKCRPGLDAIGAIVMAMPVEGARLIPKKGPW
jgi:hypothetical protein